MAQQSTVSSIPPAVPRPRHIAGLDGLRAVAAIAVVAYHTQFVVRRGDGPVAEASAAGWVGVDLFFAISGFILFLPFARARLDGGSVAVLPFYRRRLRRILPAFWLNLFVLVTLVSPSLLGTARGVATLAANATFTADYLGLPSVNSVYWSLYCEMAFYIALPLLAWTFGRRRWWWGLVLVVAVGIAYRALIVLEAPVDGSYFGLIMQFPGVIDQFGVGMAAAALWARLETRPDRVPTWLLTAMQVVGLFGVVAIVVVIHRAVGLAHFWAADGAVPALLLVARPLLSACFACLLFGACFRAGPLRAVLEWSPIRYLGGVSYGIYLWHLPVARAMAEVVGVERGSSLRYLLSAAGVLAVATGWAALSYHFVEQPFLRRRPGRETLQATAPVTTPVIEPSWEDRAADRTPEPEQAG